MDTKKDKPTLMAIFQRTMPLTMCLNISGMKQKNEH